MANVEQLRRRDGVNLVQLEEDIASIRSGSSLASIALPDYVEHTAGVTRVGALSAERSFGTMSPLQKRSRPWAPS